MFRSTLFETHRPVIVIELVVNYIGLWYISDDMQNSTDLAIYVATYWAQTILKENHGGRVLSTRKAKENLEGSNIQSCSLYEKCYNSSVPRY